MAKDLAMDLLFALSGQESGGNTKAYNSLGKAKGKYQFQQGTWNFAANQAGRRDLVGVDPRNTSGTDQDIVADAYARYLLKKYNGDPRYVAAAWYAGEKNADYYQKRGRFPTNKQKGGYPSVAQYVNEVVGRLGNSKGSYSLVGAFDHSTDPFGAKEPTVPTVEPEKPRLLTEIKDKFLDSFYDSTFGGAIRNAWANITSAPVDRDSILAAQTYKIKQEDVDFVNKALPGDFIAQKYVLMNARNSNHLARLVQMKQEDIARRERVESYGIGLSTIGTIAGTVADPLMFLPLGQEAVGVKLLSRLGKVGHTLLLSKMARYAELAVTNSAINVAERKGAEKFAGYNQNYGVAAAVGGVAGGGLGMLGDLIRGGLKHKGLEKVAGALDNAESHAIAHAADAELPNAVPKTTKGEVFNLHDPEFSSSIKSKNLRKLIEGEKAFVVAKNDIRELGKQWGIDIPENAKAFYVPGEDYTVLIKDNIKAGDNIDNILAHEVGVHAGLKKTLGEETYNKVMASVEKRMANPNKEWEEAIRSVPGGGKEEVLGHWIEKAPQKDPIFTTIKNNVSSFLRKMGVTTELTDGEIKDFVKRSLQMQVENAQGFRMLADGTAVINGLKYSAANIFHPNIRADVYALENDVLQETQGDLKILKGLSKSLEAGKFFGTIGGILSNSKSHVGRQLASTLFHDARMRSYKGSLVIPVEKQKEHIKTRLNTYFGDYMDLRTKHLFDTIVTDGIPTYARAQDFNTQVREAYNAIYTNNHNGLVEKNWHPDIVKAAGAIKKLRDDIIEIGKKSSEMFGTKGKNLIEKDWEALDDELWRVLDEDKWVSFVNKKWASVKDAQDFLTSYAEKAVKRDKVEERLLARKIKEWEETVKDIPEGTPKPEKPTEVPKEELEAYIKEEARNWAYGLIDRDNSNLEHTKGSDGHLSFFRERLPMDTTTILETPYGEMFSFDTHLRDDDLDRIIPKVIDRFSGEAAFRNAFATPDDFKNARDKYESQLKHAISNQEMTLAEKKRELDVFDDGVAMIRGTYSSKDVRGRWDAAARMFANLSYSQNGANMGFNQWGEMGGAIAYSGGRAVFHLLPELADFVRGLHGGKGYAQAVREAEMMMFGDTLESRIWSNASHADSRVFKEASTIGSKLRHLDKVNTALNYASKVTSTINWLPKLTDRMIRGARADVIADSLEWAGGKEFSNIRNPFSPKKLKASGINDVLAEQIKKDINFYSVKDSNGKVKDLMVESWMKENPETFFKWKFLIDNQGMRAIQQHSIGNKNVLKDSSTFSRIFFQFKDFTLKAVNGQTMRALTNREIDDGLAAMFSMATNMAVYAGLTVGRAYSYFPNDEGRRQEYLESRLAPEQLAMAAILRGVISGSVLGFGRDAYEAITGAQSFRTTVDRTDEFHRNKERDIGDITGDFIEQLPVVRAAKSVGDVGYTGYKALTSEDEVTKRDLQKLYRSLPLQNFLPMVYISSQFIDDSDLPDK